MKTKKKSECGMALVIVLGLISLLLISGATFAIMMRVSRASSANAKSATVATQMVRCALAHAIAAIDREANDLNYPVFCDTNNLGSLTWKTDSFNSDEDRHKRRDSTFPAEALFSVDYSVSDSNKTAKAQVMSSSAEGCIPAGLRYKAYAEKIGSEEISPPEWIPVKGGGETVGRIAYQIFNTTGLVDFSSVANSSQTYAQRWMGQYTDEISAPPFYLKPGISAPNPFQGGGAYDGVKHFENANSSRLSEAAAYSVFSYSPFDDGKLMIGSMGENDLKQMKGEIIDAFKESGLTERQARWAYLGLLDYVDGDFSPAYDASLDLPQAKAWARPATEMVPLFNGFELNLNIKRRETFNKVRIPNPAWTEDNGLPKDVEVNVFDGTNYIFTVEGGGKVVFADCVPDVDPNTNPEWWEMQVEGKLAVYFNTEAELSDPESLKRLNSPVMSARSPFIDYMESSGNLSFSKEEKITNPGETPNLPNANDLNEDESNFGQMEIHAVGAGKTFAPIPRTFPLNSANYDNNEAREDYWLKSYIGSLKFGDASRDVEDVEPVFREIPSYSDAVSKPDELMHNIKEWSTNILFWAEMTDPRYADEEMYDKDSDYGPLLAKGVYIASHSESDSPLSDSVKAHSATKDAFLNHSFEVDAYKGYSNLQRAIMTSPQAVRDLFRGQADGVVLGTSSSDPFTDDIYGPVRLSIWNRLYSKNAPIESAGELGYLPIGPWYTIRLCDQGSNDVTPTGDGFIFDDNSLPEYGVHRVLDYFTASQSVKGFVNLNTTDTNALHAVFREMPIDTEMGRDDSMKLGKGSADGYEEIGAVVSAVMDTRRELAQNALNKAEGQFLGLSELGTVFRSHDISSFPRTEADMESVVRNSCGLFTTRGQSYLVVMRGECFTPQFGKDTVKSGVSHSSRSAIAQIWRDTIPDANGKYPVFVQFFKILDE